MPRQGAHEVSFSTIARWLTAIAAALLVWWTLKLLLVLFAGILFAVFLRTGAEWLSAQTDLSERLAVVAVGAILLIALLATGALLAPEISAQLDQLSTRIPQAWTDLLTRMTRYEWGRKLLATPPNPADSAALVTNAGVLLATSLGTIAHFVVFLMVGIYLALDPAPYVAGALWLVPSHRRDEARRILRRIARVLRAWLLSRAAAMAIVAVMTTVGLWAIGLQLALTLGLAAGVMTFVPYIGAIASAAPALLLGFVQSPVLAGYVVLLYVAIHVIEGYLVTPLIEQEAIHLPPAASIAAQVILGASIGILGLVLASPIAASAIIIAQSLSVAREPAKAA